MNQWDLGSLTKDLSNLCLTALEAQSLNHWTTREVLGNHGWRKMRKKWLRSGKREPSLKECVCVSVCVCVCVCVCVSVCLVAQLCLMICDTMDCNPPVSSVHGILQARILEWVCHSLLQGIFLGFQHFRWILYHLNHQGNPRTSISGSVGKWCSQKNSGLRARWKKCSEKRLRAYGHLPVAETSTGLSIWEGSGKLVQIKKSLKYGNSNS